MFVFFYQYSKPTLPKTNMNTQNDGPRKRGQLPLKMASFLVSIRQISGV